MFSSIGWSEIFFILVFAVIIVGPERLPSLVQDVRAAIFAARKAINNAKAELNGEFDGLKEEFEPLRGPITAAAEWGRLGPRAALTKALFDGDDSAWQDFDPRVTPPAHGQHKQQAQDPRQARPSQEVRPPQQGQQSAAPGFDYSQIYPELPIQQPETQQPATQRPEDPWKDVT
ncbi:Sec-independent protein translocase TatB [Corynebacterium lizhenjunii]|uniref:Sec-independent protein translocase TatB n=1 Tax=Corynebacterium lizhenjunii TaxID=2709394 RepID=UPI00198088F3|nr:Sec-independent protein translocase TatB [Corynebacterium lizhenjunii]